MTGVWDGREHWSGLCRKSPAVHVLPAGFGILADFTHEGLPDGRGGGPGTIRRGIGAALVGMRVLNRNRQLFWFTFLAGLVLAGNAVSQAAFWYMEYNLHVPLDRIAWDFGIEFATLFCLVFLLAGLLLSVSPGNKGPVSSAEGVGGVKKYLNVIVLWSFVLALAGMLLVIVFSYIPAWFPSPELLFLYHHGFGQLDSFLFSTLSQFPFNLSRLPPPDLFTEIPGYGGRSVLLWFYYGFRETAIYSAVNLLLFVLTPFVVPLMILGHKTPGETVAGSCALMRTIGGEGAACALFLGGIVSAMFLLHILIQGACGMVTPLAVYYQPADIWIALGFVYDIALFSGAVVMATAGGIAALELFASAKTGRVPGSPEP